MTTTATPAASPSVLRQVMEALTEARSFVSSDYTGSGGKDLSNGSLSRIDAALSALRSELAVVPQQPVAVRYRNGNGRWRYLNFPFTKGWTFPDSLGTPEPLYSSPPLAARPVVAMSDNDIERMAAEFIAEDWQQDRYYRNMNIVAFARAVLAAPAPLTPKMVMLTEYEMTAVSGYAEKEPHCLFDKIQLAFAKKNGLTLERLDRAAAGGKP